MLNPQAPAATPRGPAAGPPPVAAVNPMRTFADLERQNPHLRALYDTWRQQRDARSEDSTDWDAFRASVTATGSPDPGPRPPDDFVGEEWKAQNPQWVERYRNR
jgi:hypothetical protein